MSKNGPPLANTMRGIEGRERAGWLLGGGAATLREPSGHSRWPCDRFSVCIWTAVREDNHCVCVSVPSLSCMLLDRQEIVFQLMGCVS